VEGALRGEGWVQQPQCEVLRVVKDMRIARCGVRHAGWWVEAEVQVEASAALSGCSSALGWL
jgi:hypothetical protein